MANGRVAQCQKARTTRTVTTLWIGPPAAPAASFWWTLRRCFAVVLWRHSPTHYMSLSGQRDGPPEEATPEDLLAGAHSASLAMAVGAALTAADHSPEHVRVDADCRLDHLPSGDPRIGQISLTVTAMVPGIDEDKFHRIVEAAEVTCPISQALRHNVELAIDRKLE